MNTLSRKEMKGAIEICSSEFSKHEALWITNNSWPFYAGYKKADGGLTNWIGECDGDLTLSLDSHDWNESFKLKDNGKEKEEH